MQTESVVIPDHNWLNEVNLISGESVSSCYQCKTCSSACPVSFAMDILPHQIVHMIRMGLKEEVLKSASIWICASCETCTTRCPNDIDVAKIIDTMRMASLKSDLKKGDRHPAVFHSSVLQSVKMTGKLYELGMIGLYMLRTSGDLVSNIKSGALLEDMKVGLKLFMNGKLKIIPRIVKRKSSIRKAFKKIKRGEKA